jgi:hypothetical protein
MNIKHLKCLSGKGTPTVVKILWRGAGRGALGPGEWRWIRPSLESVKITFYHAGIPLDGTVPRHGSCARCRVVVTAQIGWQQIVRATGQIQPVRRGHKRGVVWLVGSGCDGVGSSRPHQRVWVWGGGELVLGAFARLRNATVSFVVSVRPSASNISAPTGHIFMKFDISIFFENLSRKVKFHWSLTRITDTLHENQYTFFYISLTFP